MGSLNIYNMFLEKKCENSMNGLLLLLLLM